MLFVRKASKLIQLECYSYKKLIQLECYWYEKLVGAKFSTLSVFSVQPLSNDAQPNTHYQLLAQAFFGYNPLSELNPSVEKCQMMLNTTPIIAASSTSQRHHHSHYYNTAPTFLIPS